MRLEEAYTGWQEGRLTQAEVARLLGVCERTPRRQIGRYENEGMEGLIDKRLAQFSHKRAPVDEVMGLVGLYRCGYSGWNVKHFHTWYTRDHSGQRSYTWVKNQLQQAGALPQRRGRDQAALSGLAKYRERLEDAAPDMEGGGQSIRHHVRRAIHGML